MGVEIRISAKKPWVLFSLARALSLPLLRARKCTYRLLSMSGRSLPCRCPKSRRKRRRRMWQERPLRTAGSGLCELGSSSRWPPWRRCFCVRQDGGDALLIALKFIGDVEAGAGCGLRGSWFIRVRSIIRVRAAASRRHLLQRLRSRSWWTSRARSSPCLGQ
jgi:hypothetical protein